MSSEQPHSYSVHRIQSTFLTAEKILAVVLNSEDENGEIESPSSDDSLLFDKIIANSKESEEELQNFGDKTEPRFRKSGLMYYVSSLISQVQFFHNLLLFFVGYFIYLC